MERKELERVILKTIILLVIGVLVIMNFDLAIKGISLLIGFMSPMILGFAIAFVINVILSRFEKIYFPNTKNRFLQKSRRPVCIILSLLFIILVIAFVIILVIPELWDAIMLLKDEISSSYEVILNRAGMLISKVPPLESWLQNNLDLDLKHPADINWEHLLTKIGTMLLGAGSDGKFNSIMGSTVSIASNIGSGVVRFFIALVFGIYALASKERLYRQVKQLVYAYLKPQTADKLYHVCSVANETFSNFIVGQCTEAVILGVLCIIGMSIFRFDYAVMIGTLVGATALIPIVGAYLGAIVGAIMVLTQGGFWQMLLFVVFIIVLQQLEGNLIYPKVVGSSVGLPGIWVLAAVTIGGSINGVFGMLIGVPLAATIYRLLSEDSKKKVIKRSMKNQKIPTDLLASLQPPTEGITNTNTSDQVGASEEATTEATSKDTASSEEDRHLDKINHALDEIVSALDNDFDED